MKRYTFYFLARGLIPVEHQYTASKLESGHSGSDRSKQVLERTDAATLREFPLDKKDTHCFDCFVNGQLVRWLTPHD